MHSQHSEGTAQCAGATPGLNGTVGPEEFASSITGTVDASIRIGGGAFPSEALSHTAERMLRVRKARAEKRMRQVLWFWNLLKAYLGIS